MRCPHCRDTRSYYIERKAVSGPVYGVKTGSLKGEMMCDGEMLYFYCCLGCGLVYGFTEKQLEKMTEEEK